MPTFKSPFSSPHFLHYLSPLLVGRVPQSPALHQDPCLLLLLLLSRFSRVLLCATPETAAHQAPPSLGFSRQEHWNGLPFPSPMHGSEKWKRSCSVVSNSSRPHGLRPTRLLHLWDFPGKSTEWGAIAFSALSSRSSYLVWNKKICYSWNFWVPPGGGFLLLECSAPLWNHFLPPRLWGFQGPLNKKGGWLRLRNRCSFSGPWFFGAISKWPLFTFWVFKPRGSRLSILTWGKGPRQILSYF